MPIIDRRGHYLKPGVRATAPGVLFSVVVDPDVESGGAVGRDTLYTWGGADVCVSHWRRGKWSVTKGARCDTPESLEKWMQANADRSRRNYVVTPNAQETLAIGGVWESIDSGPVKWIPQNTKWSAKKAGVTDPRCSVIRRIACSRRVTILDYKRQKVRWVWVSARQYFSADEESIADSVGYQWESAPTTPTPEQPVHRLAKERSAMWLGAFASLCTWWRVHAKAPFGLTGSALSVGILRTHIKPKELVSHNHGTVHRLERDACFGGAARTWYYGDVGRPMNFHTEEIPAPTPSPYGSIDGPLTHVDVRSMYPWLLRECAYPTALTNYRLDHSPRDPQMWSEECGVIARVTIETETPEFPYRQGSHIVYPVGRFTTTLSGPDLLALKGCGRVVKCHAMARYRLGAPFKAAAGAMIDMRESARNLRNKGWEAFAKTIGVGLAGKLAQTRGEWVERPRHPAKERFGEWYETTSKAKGMRRFRAIAGCVWEYVKDTTGSGPYTAAFAYLAAYGRQHMRRLREMCPDRSVVSLDTDGMWILPGAVRALERKLPCDQRRAGDLSVDPPISAARFFDPRHYYTTIGWVLAGFSSPLVRDHGKRASDTQRMAPAPRPGGRAPVAFVIRQRSLSIAIEAHGVSIGKDGWVTPKRRTMGTEE